MDPLSWRHWICAAKPGPAAQKARTRYPSSLLATSHSTGNSEESAAFQIAAGVAFRVFRQPFRAPHRHHPASTAPSLRPEINDPIRLSNYIQAMFDHNNRVAVLDKPVEDAHQAADVPQVQTRRRLVQHVHLAGLAQLGGQP